MKRISSLLLALLTALSLSARIDLPVPENWRDVKDVQASWGDIDLRYPKYSVPMHSITTSLTLEGWRGERVSAQAVVWTGVEVESLTYEISDFKGPRRHVIPAENIRAGFTTYVMGDKYFSNGTGCGEWAKEPVIDSVLVADCIDHCLEEVSMSAMQTQGIWLTCKIPSDIPTGQYDGWLTIMNSGKQVKKLKLSLVAQENILPEPEDWHFHLDLWQNPYAVARYHDVDLWSEEHFDAMRPLMTLLAQSGQKVITATLIHRPWGGQTFDPFESMVGWTRKADGSWEYDFDIFDKWVEFMMSCGVTEQINCYSIAPWHSSFRYYDEKEACFKDYEAQLGTPEYEVFWTGMLKEFTAHLKKKGWFDKCAIAMDERPEEDMKEVIKVVRNVDPEFKLSLAGNYHPTIEAEIYDYCLAYGQKFPEEVLERRRKEGKVSTYYTCCTEITPNLFTISDPKDGLAIAMEMLSRRSDGYLRWAYNSWPEDPMTDSRFRAFTSGDTFIAYPMGRSSIRLERLVEGIQEYEKVVMQRN